MKQKPLVWIAVLLACGSLTAYVLAQQIESATPTLAPGRLADAIALLRDGNPQQATNLIATIAPGEPEYAAAQCYGALCLYELKDFVGFMKLVDAPVVKDAVIAPVIREELAFKHIDALYQYRKFENVLPKIRAFQSQCTNVARLKAATEYRLASLFERGMKQTEDACLNTDTNMFNLRWSEGRSNLVEFLSRAASFPDTNYTVHTVLQKRVLKSDVWVARMTLGDERAALDEVPLDDAASREKFSLFRIQLYLKLQPDRVDRNLQMMNDYVTLFPDSKGRKRVDFDRAGLSFQRGKILCLEAEAAEKAGDTNRVAALRFTANGYFTIQRALQSQAVVDKDAGIEALDISDLREDLLYSHLLEKNLSTLASITSTMIAESTVGDLNWTMARVYDGITLMNQTPPSPGEAAAIFDDLLARGFKNTPDHDKLVMVAARWRVKIAVDARNRTKAREVVLMVQGANCVKNIKGDFMKNHSFLLAPLPVISKKL